MIYTLTLNPSLDYVIGVDHFQSGIINRTSYEHIYAGGKGINVSTVLKTLGIDSTALGFLAGRTGKMVEEILKEKKIASDFVHVKEGFTRINVKMKSDTETEINGQGPDISQEDIQALKQKVEAMQEGDTLIISGSIPKCLPADMYEQILAWKGDKKIDCVVDAEGSLLMKVLPYHPFLIKPNHHELSALFDVDLKTREDVIPYAKKLQEKGAGNVLVSLAGEGAVLVAENGQEFMQEAPKGKVVNSVGAGDSMVAGFIAGWEEKHDYQYAFQLGIACGSATAFSSDLADREKIEEILKQMQ